MHRMLVNAEYDLPELIHQFVIDHPNKRELYFYADHLPFPIPDGKVVRVTIDYVSLAKLENRAE